MFESLECFNKETLSLQCAFGKLVTTYKWQLVMGVSTDAMKNRILIYNSILQIILNWDTRDFNLDVPKYNTLTQSELYNLVKKLKSKL